MDPFLRTGVEPFAVLIYRVGTARLVAIVKVGGHSDDA